MSTVVAVLALVLAAVLAVACGVMVLQVRALRRRARRLEERVHRLSPMPLLAPELEASFGTGKRRLLVIEILNPIELARSRSRASAVLAAMAPDRLRKLVVEQTARQMREQMQAEGVEAEIRVHAAR
jgi:ABC-type nitrate/sulfonate/bicarbonate transport system permease component